jgi:putative multiple sugar transport system permease protein
VAGHIDLSVGSVAAFTGAISAALTVQAGLPVWVVIPATLVVGRHDRGGAGLLGGLLAHPSFIVTLAGMLVFRGLTLWLLGGQNIGPFPKTFQGMANGFVPDLFGDWDQAALGLERLNGTAVLVVAVAAAVLIWLGLRARARDAEFGITPDPWASSGRAT